MTKTVAKQLTIQFQKNPAYSDWSVSVASFSIQQLFCISAVEILMKHFIGCKVNKHLSRKVFVTNLSVAPARVASPLHTAFQSDGTPRHKVFALHTHATTNVTHLQYKQTGKGRVLKNKEYILVSINNKEKRSFKSFRISPQETFYITWFTSGGKKKVPLSLDLRLNKSLKGFFKSIWKHFAQQAAVTDWITGAEQPNI